MAVPAPDRRHAGLTEARSKLGAVLLAGARDHHKPAKWINPLGCLSDAIKRRPLLSLRNRVLSVVVEPLKDETVRRCPSLGAPGHAEARISRRSIFCTRYSKMKHHHNCTWPAAPN